MAIQAPNQVLLATMATYTPVLVASVANFQQAVGVKAGE